MTDIVIKKVGSAWARSLKAPLILTLVSLSLCLLPVPKLIPAILMITVFGIILPFFGFGYITRFILAVLLLVCINTLVGLALWSVRIPLTPALLIELYDLVLVGIILAFSKSIRNIIQHQKKFLWPEAIALAFSLMAIGILIHPLALGNDATSLTRILTYTDDNTAHVSLVNNIDIHKGYLYGNKEIVESGAVNNTAYPQGWHLNTSIVEQSLMTVNKKPSPQMLLLAYYLVASAWFGSLVYLFIMLIYKLVEPLIDRRLLLVALASSSIIVGGSFLIGTMYQLFTWGAHPEIASMVLTLATIITLAEATPKTHELKKVLVALALLFIIGISFIYYFALPVVLFSTVIYIAISFRSDLTKFWRHPYIIVFGVLGLISLVPVIMYFKYINHSQSYVLNADGGTLSYANLYTLSAFLFAAVYAFRKKLLGTQLWAGVFLLSSFFFTVAIMAYQLKASGGIHYYAFKASQALMLLAIVLITAFFAEALVLLFSPGKKAHIILTSILLIISSLALLRTVHSPLYDIYLNNNPYGLGQKLAASVVSSSQSDHARTTVAIGSCYSYFDVRATLMIIALSGESDVHQAKIAIAQFSSPRERIFGLIKQYQIDTKSTITILNSDENTEEALKEYLGNDSKKFNYIDLVDKNQVDCPLRIR